MDEAEARRRFAAARVARLATVRPDGAPHAVPVTFALVDDQVFTAIDHKPKSTPDLQRLANLEHEPRCTLLVDEYADDWSRLWWVRADGVARILDDPPAEHAGLRALTDRYEPYRQQPPRGPLIAVTIRSWRAWSASRPAVS